MPIQICVAVLAQGTVDSMKWIEIGWLPGGRASCGFGHRVQGLGFA